MIEEKVNDLFKKLVKTRPEPSSAVAATVTSPAPTITAPPTIVSRTVEKTIVEKRFEMDPQIEKILTGRFISDESGRYWKVGNPLIVTDSSLPVVLVPGADTTIEPFQMSILANELRADTALALKTFSLITVSAGAYDYFAEIYHRGGIMVSQRSETNTISAPFDFEVMPVFTSSERLKIRVSNTSVLLNLTLAVLVMQFVRLDATTEVT
ncbi:MAG: hypothetical protein M0R66_03915 [Candidatus Omnitrophica bacterium]|nr:hypothetical protein [Candidatus Omnitrophota bacterium]